MSKRPTGKMKRKRTAETIAKELATARLQLEELERLFHHRGAHLPNNAEGRRCLEIGAHCVANVARLEQQYFEAVIEEELN